MLSCPWLGSFVEVVEDSNGSGLTIGMVQSLADSSRVVTLAMTSITLAMTPVLEGQAVRGIFAPFPEDPFIKRQINRDSLLV